MKQQSPTPKPHHTRRIRYMNLILTPEELQRLLEIKQLRAAINTSMRIPAMGSGTR